MQQSDIERHRDKENEKLLTRSTCLEGTDGLIHIKIENLGTVAEHAGVSKTCIAVIMDMETGALNPCTVSIHVESCR